MSAEANVTCKLTITGLGQELQAKLTVADGTTPTETTHIYKVLDTADTEEALELGGISTVAGIWIRAIDYDLDVDLDFDSTFDADLTLVAGEPASYITNPAGTVYVKNNGAAETPAFEALIFGS